jgi:ADP-ribose pyrophosphatase YjhB (NUDIX family)
VARDPIPTWFFVHTIVRKDDKFLLIHERKHGETWYLPAGRVNPSERLDKAAIRETLEESGVPVVLDGILRIEHQAMKSYTRVNTIFVAHPAADVAPISEPNEDALEARYFTLAEMLQLPLREYSVLQLLHLVEKGAPIFPLSVLSTEAFSSF